MLDILAGVDGRELLGVSGFPNSAEEAVALPLDLAQMVIKSPASTFFMRIDGAFYEEMGIHSGDIVIIDKSLPVRPGSLIAVYQGGEFCLRRVPKAISLADIHDDALLWGVVTYTIHNQLESA